ncbi:MAG TPA: hypothetical protein VFL04_05065, partial [Rectinemataceae bacterium]|nr:hypothetical protein [Rectinemataceae bacterium]
MRLDTAERIAHLIAETGRIEHESEGLYLTLGRLFPKLSDEMAKSAKNAEASLRNFDTLSSGDGTGSLRAMCSFAEGSGEFFESVHSRDSAFLTQINESIDRLGSLEGIIARVRSDSEEMEIISLNAMTVALKSGAAGKAFSVITDELKRLSGRTIALTEDVTERGRSLLEQFHRLQASVAELDAFQADFFKGIQKEMTEGFSEIEGSVNNAASFFRGLLEKARGVREPVTRVMQEVQLQDIVRQSLQHVVLSLQEAKSELAPDAPESIGGLEVEDETPERADAANLAFVGAVAELSAGLIEDIMGKLDASIQSFAADMDVVRAVVGDCERQRSDFLVGSGASCEPMDTGAYTTGSLRYLSLKRAVIAMARRLSDQVKGLDASFKGLAQILSRFQTIVVASRIEVAKTTALGGVATTVGGMISLTDRIGVDVGEAMGTTKDFIRRASDAIGSYAAREGGEGDELTATLSKVESDMACLDQARVSVCAAIDGFSLYTKEFIGLVMEVRKSLDGLRALSARLVEARTELLSLLEYIRGLPGGI